MTLREKIEVTKQEMEAAKPRSRRRIELELRLQQLRTQQLRFENLINAIEAT